MEDSRAASRHPARRPKANPDDARTVNGPRVCTEHPHLDCSPDSSENTDVELTRKSLVFYTNLLR